MKIASICILALILQNSSFAYSKKEIADTLKKQAELVNIDKRVLYTIAKIESNFTPFIISFTSKNKDFKFENVKMRISPYKNKYLISIRGNKQNLIKVAKELISKGYLVDVGIMQINSQNFTASELDKMFELNHNISKSARVLKLCGSKYNNIPHAIECYNKGFRKKASLSYYNRFKTSFLKDFAGVKL